MEFLINLHQSIAVLDEERTSALLEMLKLDGALLSGPTPLDVHEEDLQSLPSEESPETSKMSTPATTESMGFLTLDCKVKAIARIQELAARRHSQLQALSSTVFDDAGCLAAAALPHLRNAGFGDRPQSPDNNALPMIDHLSTVSHRTRGVSIASMVSSVPQHFHSGSSILSGQYFNWKNSNARRSSVDTTGSHRSVAIFGPRRAFASQESPAPSPLSDPNANNPGDLFRARMSRATEGSMPFKPEATQRRVVERAMSIVEANLRQAAEEEILDVRADLVEACLAVDAKAEMPSDCETRCFGHNDFLHLADINGGVCPMVIRSKVTFKDATSGPILRTRLGRWLIKGWRFPLAMLITIIVSALHPPEGSTEGGKLTPCEVDPPADQKAAFGAARLCMLLTLMFAGLHSTPWTVFKLTCFTFDGLVIFLSALRQVAAWTTVLRNRKLRYCKPGDVSSIDHLEWYVSSINLFIFCCLPVMMDAVRLPRCMKIAAYLMVFLALLRTYVWLMIRALDKEGYPEYHDTIIIPLWVHPLTPFDHLLAGEITIFMFFCRAFFWQVIMREDFTLLRGRFKLAF